MSYKRSVIRQFIHFSLLLAGLLSSQQSMGSNPHLRRICISATGVVTISWFPYTDTCQGFEKILIFGQQRFGNFNPVDSVFTPNQTDIAISNAAKFLGGMFYIEYVSKCIPNKISVSDTLSVDSTAPPVTDPDSVSVLSNGKVVIGWSTVPKSAYSDTKSFIINSVKGGSFPIDTIYRNKAQYGIDTAANANNGSLSYQLAVVDSCDNVSPLGGSQTTVFLGASQDSCKYTVTLSWSPYKGWHNGVRYYYVYYSTDSAKGYKYAGISDGNSYTFDSLKNYTRYYFFVRAVENTAVVITSSSNRISLTTRFQQNFKYVYIKTVTTIGSDIEIDWTTDNNPQVGYFELYRGINIASLVKIAKVSGINISGGEYSYIDNTAEATKRVWYYMVKVYNTCGHYAGESNVPHNILLVLSKSGRIKNLAWNPYDKWNGGVLGYTVLRTVEDETPTITDIMDLSGSVLNYSDLDSFSDYGRPGVCYQIKAYENGSNDVYGFSAISYSNAVCYIDSPVVYIPNAFAPTEVFNTVFKPVVTYADTLQSRLEIFNKWGERIYSTDLVKQGWDGTMKDGTRAPEDVYVYYITIIGLDLEVLRFKGTVTLL